ncbi:MAG TPA: MauE/DoxX family redox-associated membrane protein [Cyclobacteriaceae bacterium]|nr:hypothetical protein [Cyclobacteriaceae bacterium]HMV08156.1 MauE/DoxX family redox-associated membrane protein [Cyclobacteriaceae bacterium]HMX00797.1 MauE/DoxX family redox-associated membrane protein [Cyclobacteriaceae bacterium]HMX49328.1 MauE/DoxX family redox-associated membrane protein [Cyclobacteriaceae bacterium]HMY93600.1 MauE/DoxX family redox-associated membrane protein [Cyclobacteriaceae bacterium]
MIRQKQTWISLASAFLILLFTYAALSKLLDYQRFSGQIESSLLLKYWAGVLAWMIPGIELCVVVLLIVPSWRRIGFVFSALLLLMFTIYIAMMLISFDTLPCSCGGVFERMSWTQHLAFNIVFTLIAVAGIFGMSRKKILSR